jgi:hypothetical protein
MAPIRFHVSYKLPEYLAFAREHVCFVTGKERLPWLTMLYLTVVASLVFFYKKLRMPLCEFEIYDDRIVRTTSGRELVVPWNEVTAIHHYSRGYLVAQRDGAMPLPYRCLSGEQAIVLAAMIKCREAELGLPPSAPGSPR